VARVEAITVFMPGDQGAKRKALAVLGPALGALGAAPGPAPDGAALEAAEALADALEDAHFEAKRAGVEGIEVLEQVLGAARRLRSTVEGVEPQGLLEVDREIGDLRNKAMVALRRAALGPPVGPGELLRGLPPSMAQRLVSGGHYALYAHPIRPVDTEAFTGEFVAQVREVDPEASGFPVDHWETLASVRTGFREAAVLAGLAVFFLLLFDFRRLVPTLLAILPLGAGLVWAWGGMALLDLSYNPGNIIGFPLLVGIGVAASVHILHRHAQEGPGHVADVVRHTGLAVFLSTGTTMIGFGSLSLAANRAISSLGIVLLLGVGACMVTATVFLPALLAWMDEKGAGPDS
jgi:predicted RND superfamily exporter protein